MRRARRLQLVTGLGPPDLRQRLSHCFKEEMWLTTSIRTSLSSARLSESQRSTIGTRTDLRKTTTECACPLETHLPSTNSSALTSIKPAIEREQLFRLSG